MFKPITPDSDPKDIAAFAEMLPKLARFLNEDGVSRQLFADCESGKIDQDEFLARLMQRASAVDAELAE